MPDDTPPDDVQHDDAQHRFTLATDEGEAELVYLLDPDGRTIFAHTIVPESAEGQGVGSRLVRGALAEARRLGWTVVPQCPFVAAYLDRHPEDGDGIVAV
ncbi:MAG TPA: GNAT family N-acetyltransferase [Rubricoccaceae bacterium]|jgi:hypothetical protein